MSIKPAARDSAEGAKPARPRMAGARSSQAVWFSRPRVPRHERGMLSARTGARYGLSGRDVSGLAATSLPPSWRW